MPFSITPNVWTAQGITLANPGPVGYRKRFWTQAAFDTALAQIVLVAGDAGTYMGDTWRYHPDTKVLTRRLPVTSGGPPVSSADGQHNWLGPSRRDNQNLVYDSLRQRHYFFNGTDPGNSDPAGLVIDAASYNASKPGIPNPLSVYDAATDAWTFPGTNVTGNRPLLSSGAGYSPTSDVVVTIAGDDRIASSRTQQIWKMTPATLAWAQQFPAVVNASGLSAFTPRTNIENAVVWHDKARVFLIFGGTSQISPYAALNDLWAYDPAANKLIRLNPPNPPSPRSFVQMVYDQANQVVLAFGGCISPGGPFLNEVWRYRFEDNTWAQLGNLPFGLAGGCIVYAYPYNASFWFPGHEGGPINEVYAYQYAEPRATMPVALDTFLSVPKPDVDHGVPTGGDVNGKEDVKHVSAAYCPADRRGWWNNGDYLLRWLNGEIHGTSYSQKTFAGNWLTRLGAPTDRNAGWEQVHGIANKLGETSQPKHPDFHGFVWDSRRGVFWLIPGVSQTSNGTPGQHDNALGETSAAVDDPGYKWNHLFTLDPATATWTDLGPVLGNSGDSRAPTAHAETWCTVYDPVRDRFLRFQNDGTLVCWEFDPTTLVWSYRDLDLAPLSTGPDGLTSSPCNGFIRKEYLAVNHARRHIFAIDGYRGVLWRIDMNPVTGTNGQPTFTAVSLGPLPGTDPSTPKRPGSPASAIFNSSPAGDGFHDPIENRGYCVWDEFAEVLYFWRFPSLVVGNAMWRYRPYATTPAWENLDAFPRAILNGTLDPADFPHFNGGYYDRANNVTVLNGGTSGVMPGTDWLIRAAEMGVPAAVSQQAKAVSDALGLSETADRVYTQKPTTKPIAEVDLTQQPGLHGQIRRG